MLRIVGDIARGERRSAACRKRSSELAAGRVPRRSAQLVMWRLAGGMDWDSIAQLSPEGGRTKTN